MVHQQTVAEAIDVLESDAKKLFDLCVQMVHAHDGDVYPFDLFANGAANRSLALSSGFRTMIRDRNFICAGAIVRLQLDTAFRFYAGFLVNNPHQFATDVLAGKQIRNMKDVDGHRMTDWHLVDKLSAEFPWVKSLYDTTCEYIHLSGKHISHTVDVWAGPNNRFAFKIGEVDDDLPDSTYLNAIMAFQQSTLIFVRYLNGWIFTKNNPELIAKMKAERDAAANAS